MNGDSRSDIVCITQSGGVMVWMSREDSPATFDTDPWGDNNFGFCVNNADNVSFLPSKYISQWLCQSF